MNKIIIMGRLGADAETRFTPSGQKVTTFRMAVNIRKGGKDETNWYRVTLWGDRFDKMVPYFKKGSGLVVSGELRADIYTDKEGRPQINLEVTADSVHFSPFGGSNTNENQQNQAQGYAPAQNNYGSAPQYGQAASPSFAQNPVEEEPLPF